jgi:O-antigen/teichoic acid export membrane protein
MLTKFISVQVAVQAMGVASGILLVRALSQQEYAYFTIANSMLATISILADSGVGIGLTSIGGRVWKDPYRFGQLITTALRLRRYLAAGAIAVIAPVLVWMLAGNGASKAYTAVLALAVLAAFHFQLLTGVLGVVPRMHSEISRIQKLDFLIAASRLLLLCAAYFIFLNAAAAVAVGVIGVAAQYFLLRRWAADNITMNAPASEEDRFAMVGIIKSQAPNALFYCLQGQLTVWLISIFGNTQNVAEIGALGRLGVIFSVITALMSAVVLPGFARTQSLRQLRRRYFQIIGGFIIFGLMLVALAALFPDQVLWILGSKYAHLKNELLLMMILSAASALVAAMWSLNSTRAWINRSWLNIPCVIVAQIVLLSILNISTLEGVLWFGILSLAPTVILNAALTYRGLAAHKEIAHEN